MSYKIFLSIGLLYVNLMLGISQAPASDSCAMGNTDSNPPCCNGLISTDPNMADNPDYSDRVDINRFDWLRLSFPIYMPSSGYGSGTTPLSMLNPYWSSSSILRAIGFYDLALPQNGDTSLMDFHPEDGWEMISFWDGYTLSGSPISANPRVMPYMMLYNRYTGKLRLLSSLPEGNVPSILHTEMAFKYISNLGLKPSALFGKYSNQQQVLSEGTSIKNVSSFSEVPLQKGFFMNDYDMAYDPCTCNNESELQIDFSVVSGAIASKGRFTGENIPMDQIGVQPVLETENYLTSVWTTQHPDLSLVRSGYLTYHKLDALFSQYTQKSNASERLGLEVMKDILHRGLNSSIGTADGKLISRGVSMIPNWPLNLASPSKADSLKAKDTALNLLASNSDRLMSRIGIRESRKPNISVIDAGQSMIGLFQHDFDFFTGHSIALVSPGAKNSILRTAPTNWESNHLWGHFPLYNEALGVIAVLDSVEVYKYEETKMTDLTYGHKVNRYRFDNIKYTFNPAAEVDEQETKIYAALVFKNAILNTQAGISDKGTFLVNGQNVINTTVPARDEPTVTPTLGTNEYITPFFDLAYLPSYIAGDFEVFSNATVQVRLLIDYTFKKNRYGKVNKTLEVITLPVKLTNGNLLANKVIQKQAAFPNQLQISKLTTTADLSNVVYFPDVNYTENNTLSAYAQIILRGRHDVAEGKEVTYKAPEIILTTKADTLSDGTLQVSHDNVLKAGVKLVAKLPIEPSERAIKQVSQSEVSKFCQSTHYRANQYKDYIEQVSEDPAQNNTDASLRVVPNPFLGDVVLSYFVPSPSFVNFSVYNMMGQLVQTLNPQDVVYAGEYSLAWETSHLSAGVYVVVLRGNNFRKTIKVIKQ